MGEKMMEHVLRNAIRCFGYDVVKIKDPTSHFEPEFMNLFQRCAGFTMTSMERMYALWQAMNYVSKNKIEGDLVECGVWAGGSSMLMAMTLLSLGETDRKIFLYDTFAGMAEPKEQDISLRGGVADERFRTTQKDGYNEWAYASLEEVQKNMDSTGYPRKKVFFVKGMVEKTIPGSVPGKIALLRLDTDWYESTKHELIHLFPLLEKGGVLIIDDYGHWIGAKKAVDEYFQQAQYFPLLNRIDYTGRLVIKA